MSFFSGWGLWGKKHEEEEEVEPVEHVIKSIVAQTKEAASAGVLMLSAESLLPGGAPQPGEGFLIGGEAFKGLAGQIAKDVRRLRERNAKAKDAYEGEEEGDGELLRILQDLGSDLALPINAREGKARSYGESARKLAGVLEQHAQSSTTSDDLAKLLAHWYRLLDTAMGNEDKIFFDNDLDPREPPGVPGGGSAGVGWGEELGASIGFGDVFLQSRAFETLMQELVQRPGFAAALCGPEEIRRAMEKQHAGDAASHDALSDIGSFAEMEIASPTRDLRGFVRGNSLDSASSLEMLKNIKCSPQAMQFYRKTSRRTQRNIGSGTEYLVGVIEMCLIGVDPFELLASINALAQALARAEQEGCEAELKACCLGMLGTAIHECKLPKFRDRLPVDRLAAIDEKLRSVPTAWVPSEHRVRKPPSFDLGRAGPALGEGDRGDGGAISFLRGTQPQRPAAPEAHGSNGDAPARPPPPLTKGEREARDEGYARDLELSSVLLKLSSAILTLAGAGRAKGLLEHSEGHRSYERLMEGMEAAKQRIATRHGKSSQEATDARKLCSQQADEKLQGVKSIQAQAAVVGQEREALLRQMLALEEQKAEIERQIDDLARQISEKEVVAEELQARQERARRELSIGNLEAESLQRAAQSSSSQFHAGVSALERLRSVVAATHDGRAFAARELVMYADGVASAGRDTRELCLVRRLQLHMDELAVQAAVAEAVVASAKSTPLRVWASDNAQKLDSASGDIDLAADRVDLIRDDISALRPVFSALQAEPPSKSGDDGAGVRLRSTSRRSSLGPGDSEEVAGPPRLQRTRSGRIEYRRQNSGDRKNFPPKSPRHSTGDIGEESPGYHRRSSLGGAEDSDEVAAGGGGAAPPKDPVGAHGVQEAEQRGPTNPPSYPACEPKAQHRRCQPLRSGPRGAGGQRINELPPGYGRLPKGTMSVAGYDDLNRPAPDSPGHSSDVDLGLITRRMSETRYTPEPEAFLGGRWAGGRGAIDEMDVTVRSLAGALGAVQDGEGGPEGETRGGRGAWETRGGAHPPPAAPAAPAAAVGLYVEPPRGPFGLGRAPAWGGAGGMEDMPTFSYSSIYGAAVPGPSGNGKGGGAGGGGGPGNPYSSAYAPYGNGAPAGPYGGGSSAAPYRLGPYGSLHEPKASLSARREEEDEVSLC